MSNVPDLCPLDGRRGEAEVFVKRVAVMFTVLSLHGHLNSLRGIKGANQLVLRLYLTWFNPLYPALKLFFAIPWAVHKARRHSRRNLARHELPLRPHDAPIYPLYCILAAIGVHAAHESTNIETKKLEMSSISLLRLPHSSTELVPGSNETPQSSTIRMGRLLVMLGAFVQCAATLLLGIRRELRGAATAMDRRASMLAVSGLVILLQTAAAQVFSRQFRATRDSDHHAEYNWSILVEIMHYALSFILVCIYASDFETVFLGTGFSAIFSLYAHLLLVYELKSEGGPLQRGSWSSLWQRLTEPGKDYLLHFCGFWICLGFSLYYFVHAYYNPSSDHFRDASGKPVPADVSCPYLWKDPLADTLWAF